MIIVTLRSRASVKHDHFELGLALAILFDKVSNTHNVVFVSQLRLWHL